MAHQSFGAVRLAAQREPITFDFGIYGEERFTVIPDPSLGDCLDLHAAPEPTPQTSIEAVAMLVRFIRRMLDPADVPRFDAALRRIPSSESHIIISCGTWIAEQVSGFPTQPPAASSSGRRTTGKTSKPRSAGRPHSRK